MPRLVVLGSTNIDMTLRVAHLPRPGETLLARSVTTGHGGKGANQAVMAARLGATVTMIAAVGDDAFGTMALANYRANGMDVEHVRVCVNEPTGRAIILVEDSGNNEIIVAVGANASLQIADIQIASTAIARADAVLTQLETPVLAAIEAFRIARSAGVRTLLNPAPALPLPEELLQLTDLCVPNETELAVLTGMACGSLAEIEAAAHCLLARGPRLVLVTLGGRGVLRVNASQTTHFPAVPVQAVDATAAGDAFLGSLAVFLAEGQDEDAAIKGACAVAALTVTRHGAQDSFPSQRELAEFLEKKP